MSGSSDHAAPEGERPVAAQAARVADRLDRGDFSIQILYQQDSGETGMNQRFTNLWNTLRMQPAALQAALNRRPEPRDEAPPPAPEPPRRLGLALGGGGGKGGAHLGVLDVLEELEIPIDAIAGTSAGAFVAIMYALGYRPNEIAGLIADFALRRIAVADPLRTGFIGSRKREARLREILGDATFADTRIPCAVTATDLASGRLVVLDEGPLVPAILATTALPGIFPPVLRERQVLADGGVLNNLPVDVAAALGATRVIAVQLVAEQADAALLPEPPAHPLARLRLAPRQFALASRALDLMIAEMTRLRLAQCPPALLLTPDVGQIGTLDMRRAAEGYRAGQTSARAAGAELLMLRTWRLSQAELAPAPAPRPALGTITGAQI
jgi:NTE family protein